MKKFIISFIQKYPNLYLFVELFRPRGLKAVNGDLQSVHNQFSLTDNAETIAVDLGCGPNPMNRFNANKAYGVDLYEDNEKGVLKCRLGFEKLPFDDNSMDFGYSLGVLHHIPDTLDGMKKCVDKLKKDSPFLVYLYYAFDNQPFWYRLIWKFSDFFRRIISKFPFKLKLVLTNIIAFLIYLPLATLSKILKNIGFNIHSFPLSNYHDKSFYTMKTDALDRFGTRLELRYTKKEIIDMMEKSGLKDIIFSTSNPFWCAVGIKK